MNKEYMQSLEDLSKQEIIVKKGIGVYMDGSVQTMPHKTTVGIEFKGQIETLKQALTELQAIKEAESSEALRTLEVLDEIISPLLEPVLAEYEDDLSDTITANYFALRRILLNAQELEKKLDDSLLFQNGNFMSGFDYKGEQVVAMPLEEYSRLMEQDEMLDLIKEKNVDIELLKESEDRSEYNMHFPYREIYHLTEGEFNTLKERLK